MNSENKENKEINMNDLFKKMTPEIVNKLVEKYKDIEPPIVMNIHRGNDYYRIDVLDYVYINMNGLLHLNIIDTSGIFHILNDVYVIDIKFNESDDIAYYRYNKTVLESREYYEEVEKFKDDDKNNLSNVNYM